ncbi:hypothetical protein C2G38_2211846 [Gigaspora rosea]|uniref:DUF7431 domain-containing protein n=1 Tax=Gigaspora rosea TaxID=44941 RepID=A0A397UGL7_9GLOM|nr:hypothetical protein C2G38_2211846 [Gigaspora rosea]
MLVVKSFKTDNNNAGNFGEVTAQTSNKDEEQKREVVKDIGFEVVGGSKDQDDITSWITSLSDWKNWEIVGYEDEPIFNLLDNHQRDRIIKKIVGKRILKKGLIHINESNIEGSYHLHSLKINSDNDKLKLTCNNRDEYQIFAFVVDKKRKSDIYSIRVVYKNDDHKLLIHCIEGNKNEFDLHVGWIIVGYPKTFDVEEPEFKCSEHIKETDTIQVDLDDFPLITCVQDLQPLDDYNKYNSIALGVTFSKEDCISDACLFAYNVKSRQLEQIDDWSAFSINYSSISSNTEQKLWKRHFFDLNNWYLTITVKKRREIKMRIKMEIESLSVSITKNDL